MKKLFTAFLLLIAGAAFGQQAGSTTTSTQSTSVSISNSDNEYSLNANFAPEKAATVRPLIIKALGQAGESIKGETTWGLKDTYTVMLTSEKLNIRMDKDNASGLLYKLITRLGKDIQDTLTKLPVAEIKN